MRSLLLAAVAATFFTVSAPAHAGLLPGPCPAASIGQPFAPWLDYMSYVPAPNGGLENGASGWTLRGGATVVHGNEPYFVGGDGDSRSLAIPAGGSATTAAMCAGLDHPTIRFFARRTSGSLSSSATLRVEALHDGLDGKVRSTPIGSVAASGAWQPTLPLPIAVNLIPHLGSDRAAVAFRFTALGGGFAIDDVYVDPYGRY